MITIYHNPRCSKSRATLALLRENGIEPEIVDYLQTPPDAATLKAIAAMLGGTLRDIIRTDEEAYRPSLSEEKLAELVAENPRLLQRPIVVCRDKNGKRNRAALGRPPENILSIL